MQLVAYGAQDVYLSGKPQITFWKLMYRRHTNFATESIQQTFNGTPGFGRRAAATVSRNGDLISHVFLQIKAPKLKQPTIDDSTDTTLTFAKWDYKNNQQSGVAGEAINQHALVHEVVGGYARYCNSFAHALVDYCEIEIGGQRIDKHYSGFFETMDELTCPEEKRLGYGNMIGKSYGTNGLPADSYNPDDVATTKTVSSQAGQDADVMFYMPLRFWFNSNPGLALPLIALQYHEVKIGIQFKNLSELVVFDVGYGPNQNAPAVAPDTVATLGLTATQVTPLYESYTIETDGGNSELTAELYVDYVYLDTDERRRFAQNQHEYLIEQLQFTGSESESLRSDSALTGKYRLNFNHPCKELIFFAQDTDDIAKNIHFNFGENTSTSTSKGIDYVKSVTLQLNGHDRFSERQGSYFRMVQPYQCHTRVPSRHVYCYSFGLRPEEHQPSGSCNFSRIDNANLSLNYAATTANIKVTVYAINYNILRIMSGMGGLAYSN